MKINLGAGNDIRSEYINHDMVGLEGIDVVHDLNIYPWPWPSNCASELVIRDVFRAS